MGARIEIGGTRGASVRIFTNDVDAGSIRQLSEVAQLPCVLDPVVAMPDVHVGIGATIGSVIQTKDAVIPSAVGVDIGCFAGDTKVPLLNGRQMPLKAMAEQGGEYWVYSIDPESLRIVPGKATALKTRENAELMRVVVSGGDEIVCTPDHEFMLRDGSYRAAADLKFNDSLMPLYRSWSARDGYESASNGKGTAMRTHVLVYEHCHGPVPDGHSIHHANHSHFDNTPGNLMAVSASAHSTYHRRVGRKFPNDDPDFQKRRLAGIRRKNSEPERQAQMADVGRKNITTYMDDRPEHFRESVAGNGERGAPFLAAFNTTPRDCPECDHIAKNPAALRWHREKMHTSNHKVLDVEPLGDRADVYCLQVKDHHNFALAAGVFVHNCGMSASLTDLKADHLPDDLSHLRKAIEKRVPVGFGKHQKPTASTEVLGLLHQRIDRTLAAHPKIKAMTRNDLQETAALQLGTLGGGNHFLEICLDLDDNVWVMLHSGSRGMGNVFGRYFMKEAKTLAGAGLGKLPSKDLAYLSVGQPEFIDYLLAVDTAQWYAKQNRRLMMQAALDALTEMRRGNVVLVQMGVDCHHNFVIPEPERGDGVYVTRKGAIRMRAGDWGIVPGSMGAKSYIVSGKGCADALESCPHGAGRRMSRTKAKQMFSAADLEKQTAGVECRKDSGVIDEIPEAYKPIDEVMANAADMVEIVHTLRQVVCVKG